MDQQLCWLLQPEVLHAVAALCIQLPPHHCPHGHARNVLSHPDVDLLSQFEHGANCEQHHHDHCLFYVRDVDLHLDQLHKVSLEACFGKLHYNREPRARRRCQEQVRYWPWSELGAGFWFESQAMVATRTCTSISACGRWCSL